MYSQMEVTMKLKGKFGVITLAFTLMLASACIANAAGTIGGGDGQNAQATNSQIARDSQDVNSSGAARVDRDLEASHQDDVDQYGGDGAYKATTGRTNKETDSRAHHWVPESYGLTGSYGRDSR
jgi:hypothetical protein